MMNQRFVTQAHIIELQFYDSQLLTPLHRKEESLFKAKCVC